jgi:hypothetical protein
MKTLIFPLFLLLSFVSNAQSPWRAKLIIYFEDSSSNLHPDTIWFGCDRLGDDGFQEGLDVFDNRTPQMDQVTGFDSVTNIQFPGKRLRTNIKAFKFDKGFNFQVRCNGIVKYIKWDSLEFKYQSDKVIRLSASISAREGVSFEVWHKNEITLTDSWTQLTSDMIEVLEGGEWLNFNLRIYLVSIYSALSEPSFMNNKLSLKQINGDKFLLSAEKVLDGELTIYSLTGQVIEKQTLHNCLSKEFDLSGLPPGLYLVQYIDTNTKFSHKIIKH